MNNMDYIAFSNFHDLLCILNFWCCIDNNKNSLYIMSYRVFFVNSFKRGTVNLSLRECRNFPENVFCHSGCFWFFFRIRSLIKPTPVLPENPFLSCMMRVYVCPSSRVMEVLILRRALKVRLFENPIPATNFPFSVLSMIRHIVSPGVASYCTNALAFTAFGGRVGFIVGIFVGAALGTALGMELGEEDGIKEGETLGTKLGASLGDVEGGIVTVGELVG